MRCSSPFPKPNSRPAAARNTGGRELARGDVEHFPTPWVNSHRSRPGAVTPALENRRTEVAGPRGALAPSGSRRPSGAAESTAKPASGTCSNTNRKRHASPRMGGQFADRDDPAGGQPARVRDLQPRGRLVHHAATRPRRRAIASPLRQLSAEREASRPALHSVAGSTLKPATTTMKTFAYPGSAGLAGDVEKSNAHLRLGCLLARGSPKSGRIPARRG